MKKSKIPYYIRMHKYLVISFILIFSSCINQKEQKPLNLWADIVKKGEITFLSLNASSSYTQGRDGELEGFEYELARAFAIDHGLKYRFETLENVDAVLERLKDGYGELAVAGLTNTKKRREHFEFGPTYNSVYQTVVCKKRVRVKRAKDLTKLNLTVASRTSFEETLKFLKGMYPTLSWESIKDANTEVLIQYIWKSEDKCTIADSHIVDLHRRYLPELAKVFQFKNVNYLGWAFNKRDNKMKKILRKWFSKKKTQTLIADLKRKYFEFIEFDSYNLKVFNKRIKSRLPKYIKYFKEAAKKENLPWEFIAAVGYQESFWDPKAKSPTGVRGLMMLTRKTAKELKVKNRLDAKQSIMGGAKYLRKLINRMPSYLNEKDRLWFALASYNVGYYHLRDALALTIWRNKNPTRWHSVEKVLPLLSQKKYYKRLVYGHARGLEPVIYVKRIKDFYDILRKKRFEFENKKRPLQ